MTPLLLTLAVMLPGGDGPGKDTVKDDMQRLQGTWAIETPIFGGKRTESLTFKGDRVVWKKEGRQWGRTASLELHLAYTLDPSHDPKRITMKWKSLSPDLFFVGSLTALLGGHRTGIYAFDGDTLRLAFPRSGQELPKDFKGKPVEHDDYGPFAFKRVKPAPGP